MEQILKRSTRKYSYSGSPSKSPEENSSEEYVAGEYVREDTLLSILPILGSFLPPEALKYLHSSSSNINKVLVETERDPGFWVRKIESEFDVTVPEFSSVQEREGSIWKRNNWKQVYYEMIEGDPLKSDNPDIIEILLTNPKYHGKYRHMQNAAKLGKIGALKVFLSDPELVVSDAKEIAFMISAEAGQLESGMVLLKEEGLNIFGERGLLSYVVEYGYPNFVQLIFDTFQTGMTDDKKQALLQESYENQKDRIRFEEERKRALVYFTGKR